MPWINRDVQYCFQLLINELTTFHQDCSKQKYQFTFMQIAEACEMARVLFYQENQPEGADVGFSTLSGVIQTQLTELLSKKIGNENSAEFSTGFAKSFAALVHLKDIYQQNLGRQDIRPAMTQALTHLDDVFVLRQKIADLYFLPNQAQESAVTFFKRAVKRHPKISSASGAMAMVGAAGELFSVLDRVLGENSKNQTTGLDYKDIVAIFLFTAAMMLFMGALISSCCRSVKLRQSQNDNNISDLKKPLISGNLV